MSEFSEVSQQVIDQVKILESELGSDQLHLQEIESEVQSRMEKFAQAIGGEYIAPNVDELVDKFDRVLSTGDEIDYQMDESGYIWKRGKGSKSALAYNEMGNHGTILVNHERKTEGVRVYRAAIIDPSESQTAPMARLPGVEVGIYGGVDKVNNSSIW